MARSVHRPKITVDMPSPHQSRRTTWPPRLIVLHDTEYHDYDKARDLIAIGQWFRSNRVSAHIAVNSMGMTGCYVPSAAKAWHVCDYNSASIGIEQVGFARFTSLMWNRNHRKQVRTVAKWIAYWSQEYAIPIQRAEVSHGRVVKPGITTHARLGVAGGGHGDPGKGYPFRTVLRMARWYKRHGW